MTVQYNRYTDAGGTHRVEWLGLSNADGDGDKIKAPGAGDKCVQVTGNFDSGTLTLEGSNVLDPGASDWVALNDTFGVALSFTSGGLRAVTESPLWVRARLTGAGASADVNVYLLARRTT